MLIRSENERATLLGGSIRKRGVFVLVTCVLSIGMVGCSLFKAQPRPTSLGETMSGYTYVPIDPTKVQIETGECAISYSDIGNDAKKLKLLDMLPDNAVRMSMESFDSSGKVTYGVSKVGTTGAAYKLTADYVNSDTVNKSVWIRRTMMLRFTKTAYDSAGKVTAREETSQRLPVSLALGAETNSKLVSGERTGKEEIQAIPGTDLYDVRSLDPAEDRKQVQEKGYEEFNVPIYVGIGLRVVAEGISLSGDANIAGIGVIGAEAEAKRLLGSLTVQTLGINSQAVASALPVHSELSRTTAENAFVAIGSIKSMLHQAETIKFPRVVGLYLPFPGGKPLVNALISELSRTPVTWCPNGYSIKDKPPATQNEKGSDAQPRAPDTPPAAPPAEGKR